MKWILLFLLSCSHINFQNREEVTHRNYLSAVEEKKKTSSKKAYREFVQKELVKKERELVHLEHYRRERRKHLNYNEAGIDGRNIHGVSSFKARSGKWEEGKLQEEINILNREILFLRSQLPNQ